MATEQAEAEFRQRILAASQGPTDPLLYWHIFDPENAPADPVDDTAVFFPTTAEEFEAMVEEWKAAELLETPEAPADESLAKDAPEHHVDVEQ